jgi:NitT/TauT family transport system ATP-binding protein
MITAADVRSDLPQPTAAVVPAIELKGVTKAFAGADGAPVHALGPVDLRIEPGSFVAVVGPSGCGKSTLLRLVAGLEMPDAGTMQRYGSPLDGPSHEVGIVFQEHVLFPWITVLENVLLPADVLSLPKAASRERAMHLLEMPASRTLPICARKCCRAA